jgi:hypothetical protein
LVSTDTIVLSCGPDGSGAIGEMKAHSPWRCAVHPGAIFLAASVGGCAAHGAPTFVLVGAYFPAWLLLAVIGVLAGVAARVAMVATGLATTVPFQLLCCTAIGVTAALFSWLVWFAR